MGVDIGVFNPDELELLKAVLDEATEALPIADRTSAVKAVLAQKVIACAREGERDRIRLRTRVLTQFRTDAIKVARPTDKVLPWNT